MVHHPVAWKVLLDVILHVFLQLERQIAQVQVALFVVPGDDLRPRAFFRMFADPVCNFRVSRAGGDKLSTARAAKT